jgi:hypothetical protein
MLKWNVFGTVQVNFFLLHLLLGVWTKDTEKQDKESKLKKIWGTDDQHWVNVNRGFCDCRQERSCQTAPDHASLYQQGRESGTQQMSWKALAIDRKLWNPSWCDHWQPTSSVKIGVSCLTEVHPTKQTNKSFWPREQSRPETEGSLKRHSNNVDWKGVAGNNFCKVENKIGHQHSF